MPIHQLNLDIPMVFSLYLSTGEVTLIKENR